MLSSTEIARPRILARLPGIGEARVIAITAPSGFGKSTVLRQWADGAPRPIAWLDATKDLDSIPRFNDALAAALHRALPRQNVMTSRPTLPELAREVGRSGCAIVIDDLHELTDRSVLAEISDLVRLCPPSTTIALASRTRLPIAARDLMLAEDAVVLGADALAFTLDETSMLLSCPAATDAGCGRNIPAEWLQRFTEGWPAPVSRIASILLTTDPCRREVEVDAACSAFVDRVLGALPSDLAEFMVDTAHLDELDTELCAAVTGAPDVARMVSTLADEHLLLTGRDGLPRHRRMLSRTLVRRQRDDPRRGTQERQRRAAEWYLCRNRPDRAIDHARAGDLEVSGSLLASAVRTAVSAANGAALKRWARTIPLDAPADREARDLALVAASFLPRHHRGRWSPGDHPRDDLVHLAVTACDLARSGCPEESSDSLLRARSVLAGSEGAADAVIDALLWVVDEENALTVGGAPDPGRTPELVLDGSWPWLTQWAYGQRAMRAIATGDLSLSSALIDRCNEETGPLHPSWVVAAPSWFVVADAVAQLSRSGVDNRSIDSITRLVRRANRAHDPSLAVLARCLRSLASTHLDGRGGHLPALRPAARGTDPPAVVTAACDQLVAAFESRDEPGAALSRRERTILEHLDSDMTAAEIAAVLHISVHTVRAHTRSIYRKLGVGSRIRATATQRPPAHL